MKMMIVTLLACAIAAPAFAADTSAPADEMKMEKTQKKSHHRLNKPHKKQDMHKKDMKSEHQNASMAQ
jgi:hypothetical protein